MYKLFDKFTTLLVNLLLYSLIISFLFTLTYSIYQTFININSWSELTQRISNSIKQLPQLNSLLLYFSNLV
ncbi:hypothetical protein JCM16358_01990 [Halanaerocella petrolearia]